MVTNVVLAKFTDQGIRNAKDSPRRADAFKQMAKTFGVTVKDIFWTQGRMTSGQSSKRQMSRPPCRLA